MITTEGDYFDKAGVIEKDHAGRIIKLNFPSKLVIISNHQASLQPCSSMPIITFRLRSLQVYLDWWYLWSLTYWMGGHKDVIIVLKKSLKWIPIVGWVSHSQIHPKFRNSYTRV
jgi:1-acyl-sn-glycerol-3-phosphate acyltransferase